MHYYVVCISDALGESVLDNVMEGVGDGQALSDWYPAELGLSFRFNLANWNC